MRNILKIISFVYLAAFGTALCASAVGGQGNAIFVQQQGRTITVLPTCVDDTANLQCAFDKAVALSPGVTVRLVEGTYHIRQIVANGFKGAFIGAGSDKSVLTNLPNLVVNPALGETVGRPSGGNPWPALVTFVGGDFLVSDVGMSITGDKPRDGRYLGYPHLWNFTNCCLGLDLRALRRTRFSCGLISRDNRRRTTCLATT